MQNILVVDDNEELLDTLDILITTFGFNVAVATSYDSLIKTFEEYLPDAIILDVVLGNEDGRQICKRLKSDPKTSKICVILLSAKSNFLENPEGCLADGVLMKPFDITAFKKIIKNF